MSLLIDVKYYTTAKIHTLHENATDVNMLDNCMIWTVKNFFKNWHDSKWCGIHCASSSACLSNHVALIHLKILVFIALTPSIIT